MSYNDINKFLSSTSCYYVILVLIDLHFIQHCLLRSIQQLLRLILIIHFQIYSFYNHINAEKSLIAESKLFIKPLQCNVVYDVNNPKKGYVVGTAVIR